MHAEPQSIPVMVSWDMEYAFTSVVKELVIFGFQSLGFPKGVINVIAGVICDAKCFTCISYKILYLYQTLTGIIQGCATAGLSFAVALDPFACKLEDDVPDTKHGQGTV